MRLVAPSYYARPVNRRLNILLDHKTGVTSDDVLTHLCHPRSNIWLHYHQIYSLESYTINGGPYNLVVHILSRRLLHRVTHSYAHHTLFPYNSLLLNNTNKLYKEYSHSIHERAFISHSLYTYVLLPVNM